MEEHELYSLIERAKERLIQVGDVIRVAEFALLLLSERGLHAKNASRIGESADQDTSDAP